MKDRRSGWPSCLTRLIPIGAATFVFAVAPFSIIAFLFWAADGSWEFEGRSGLRYWLLVGDSRLDQLGLVSPEPSSQPRYSVRLQEGTFPGWRVLSYRSTEQPETIVATYAKRCSEMGLKIAAGPRPETFEGEDAGASLVCEIETFLDAEFHAGRKAGGTTTDVSVRVWGSD